MSVNVRALSLSPLSRSIDWLSRSLRCRKCSGCTSQKSSLHHDPDCAMSLFVLLLAPTHLLRQNSRRTQPCTFCVCSELPWTPAESWVKNPYSERRLSRSKHEFQRASVEQHVCVDSVLVQREIRLRLATTPSWLTAVLPVSRPSTP